MFNALQLASGGMMQAGQHYLQQQLTTQSLMAAARSSSSMLYGQQQQQSLSALQQQQAYHNQLGMSSSGGGSSSGFHMLQNDNTHNSNTSLGFPDFGRGLGSGNKQDIGTSLSDQGRGGSSSSHGGENLYLKAADDGN